MSLARPASSLPATFTSSAPSAASGADPVARTELPPPALTATSSDVRPAPRRPEPATSSAGSAALRVCGALKPFSRTRQSPDGSSGVPLIVASPSAAPERPRPGAARSSAESGSAAAFARRSSVDAGVTAERKPAGADGEHEIVDVETVARRRRQSVGRTSASLWPAPCALRLASSRRVDGPPNSRPRAFSASPRTGRAEIEIARIGAGRRGQLDIGNRLSAERAPGEAGDARTGSSLPQTSSTVRSILRPSNWALDAHPVAVGDDRDVLPPAGARGAELRLKRAAEFGQNQRREIVEIGGAEIEFAARQPIRADREIARQARRGQADREIVGGPAAVGAPGEMSRAGQRLAIDVALHAKRWRR